MKHTWSFCNFCNWKQSSYFSSNDTLKWLKGVCILTKSLMHCLCFLLLISLCGALGRIRVRHTCIACIAKPNNGSMKKYVILLDQDVHVCMTWFFLHLYLRAWLFSLFLLTMDLHVSTFFFFFYYEPSCVHIFFVFNYGPSCVHIFSFQYFFISHASFARIMEKNLIWTHGVFIWWKWKCMFCLLPV
jgi:hypothetical protein